MWASRSQETFSTQKTFLLSLTFSNLSTVADAFWKGPLANAALTAAFKALLRPYLPLLTCLAASVDALQTIKKPLKKRSIMFTAAAAVAAVAAATAEVLVESLVIAALLLLLGAAGVAVVRVIVAVPSTISTLVSFVSSQEKKLVAVDDNCVDADAEVDDKPAVIELLDDDDEEVSSDEEEEGEDDVVFLGTFGSSSSAAAAPELSRGRPRQRTATRCPRKATVTAAPERPRKKSTTAAAAAPKSPAKKAAAASAPERPYNKAAAAPAVLERPRKKTVSIGTVQVQEYSLIVGDHPCSEEIGGFPLSLDWAHTTAKEYSVDALEREKASSLPRPDMTPADRMLRIAAVAGIAPADVQKQERTRLWKVEAEKLAARPVRRDPTGGN
jgi:hypothetical protein